MLRNRLWIVLISLVMLIPCFWQKRIPSGDLGSHLYVAWLTTEVEAGRGDGLELANPATNMLVDRVLVALTRVGGPGLAEHVVVPVLVLILFWGAVQWIRTVTGSMPWALMPCLAMVAYGWVFYMGFLNFYLSTGLVFWALALLWNPTRARFGVGVPLLAVAYAAHAIAVLWGCAILLYVWAARRLSGRRAVWLPVGALAAVGLFRLVLEWRYKTMVTSQQWLEMWGIDQVWVFGIKYVAVVVLLGTLWGFHVLRLVYSRPARWLLGNVCVQLCAVMSLAILITPSRVELTAYPLPLSFVTERMTLPFAVLLCVLLNQIAAPRWQTVTLGVVAALQFSFLYADGRTLNGWEDRVEAAVAGLPRGARVISSLHDYGSRSTLWLHAVDRACIGRCYSYANYEPASLAFQIQARRPNGIVMHDLEDVGAVEGGTYVARPGDLPLYQLVPCQGGRLCAEAMAAGERMRTVELGMLPLLW